MGNVRRPDYSQRLLLPPSLDEWVSLSHPVRFVRDFVELLDLDELGIQQPSGEVGRPPYCREMLLCVWLFGWMERVRSSRALEKSCQRDIAFLWLTGNLHPDHNSLWRFFRDNKKAIPKLFKRVVNIAVEANLVGFVLHALDGTKLKAASSTETAWHRKHLDELLKRLDELVAESLRNIEAAEADDPTHYAMDEELLDVQKRRDLIRQKLATLDKAEVDHLHPAEPEALVCKLGPERALAYNAQAVMDRKSDLIVAADVVTDQGDHDQLTPMLKQVDDNTGATAECSLADGGYFSGPELAKAEAEEFRVLVQPLADPNGKGQFAKEHFQYDEQRDGFVCPQGELLKLSKIHNRTHQTTYEYRCHNKQCPVLAQCTRDPKGRSVTRSPHDALVKRARENFKDAAVQRLYSKRKAIIEHLFGDAKSNHGFRRFTVRGLVGAKAQWALMCLAINLKKLYKRWLSGDFAIPQTT